MFWDGHIKEWNELPRANRNLNTIDEEDITDWMTQKFLHENVGLAKKHKKEQGQAPSANLNSTPQGQGSGSGSRKRCHSHGHGQQGQGNHSQNQQNQNQMQRVQLQADGPCPNHPNGHHNWGQCNLNPTNRVPGSGQGHGRGQTQGVNTGHGNGGGQGNQGQQDTQGTTGRSYYNTSGNNSQRPAASIGMNEAQGSHTTGSQATGENANYDHYYYSSSQRTTPHGNGQEDSSWRRNHM